MRFAFVEAAKAICSEGLHQTYINERIVVVHECVTGQRNEVVQVFEIMIEQLLTQCWWQISFGVIQERCDVVLERTAAAALVIDKKRGAFMQHDVT